MRKHRERWTEAHARKVLAAWKTSKLTLSAYARRIGTTEQRLGYWRERLESWTADAPHELRTIDDSPRREPVEMVAATVVERSADRAQVIVRTPEGIVVELDGAPPSYVAYLVRQLMRVP